MNSPFFLSCALLPMSPSERYPLVIFSGTSSTDTSDEDEEADGEELLVVAARAAA